MSFFEAASYASTAALEVVMTTATTTTNIIRSAPTHSNTTPAETHTNAPAPGFSKPFSPTTIGLMCGLGGCGILGFIVWAVVYFQWFKPIGMPTEKGKAGHHDGAMTEQNKNKNRNSHIVDATRGVLLHSASGITTARPSTDGGVYPSVGIAVNTALEREILEILEAEVATIGRCRGLGSGLV